MISEGKVANVLNARELVINIGQEDGVHVGMRFKVLADTPTQITDPETEEVIGVVDREKVRVEATEVQDNITVCRTYETVRVGGFGVPDMSRFLSPPKTVPKTLKAGDQSHLPPLPESESYVKRGDRVVEVRETKADTAT